MGSSNKDLSHWIISAQSPDPCWTCKQFDGSGLLLNFVARLAGADLFNNFVDRAALLTICAVPWCSHRGQSVDADHEVMSKDADTETILNGNVLIEIGAAMALYRRRFILFVRDSILLPSNLQGLYEMRYTVENWMGKRPSKLLKAVRVQNRTSCSDELSPN